MFHRTTITLNQYSRNTSAIRGFDTRLEHDISQISNDHLTALVKLKGPIDYVVAGWECQMVSRGRFKLGYKDERFPYFFDLIQSWVFVVRLRTRTQILRTVRGHRR